MSYRSEANILHRIATVSRKIFRLLQPTSSATLPSRTPLTPLPDSKPDALATDIFPAPQFPIPVLIGMGLDHKTASRISQTYIQTATRFRTVCAMHYGRAYSLYSLDEARRDTSKLRTLLRMAYLEKYSKMLHLWLSEIIQKVGSHLDEVREGQEWNTASQHKQIRPRFNQDAIPDLEVFFARNAFPSRSEKENLAAATGMDYKQINVWFQNHRSRCRKDGRQLRRGNAFVALPSDLSHSISKILSHVSGTSSPAREHTNSQGTELGSATTIGAVSSQEAPAHAFPTTYPPLCSYSPFPAGAAARKLATPWMRKCTSRHDHGPPVDVARLTSMLASLTVADDTEHRKGKKSSTEPLRGCPSEYTGFATAGIQTPFTLLSTVPTELPLTVPNKTTEEPTLPAAGQTRRANPGRKFAGLPRRLPTSPSVNHSGVSHDLSTVSTSSSSSSTPSLSLSSILSLSSVAAATPSPSHVLKRSDSWRKISPLPERRKSSYPAVSATPSQFSHTPYSRTISRSSSLSSLSSQSSISTSSEIDTPLSTPPSIPAILPALRTSEYAFPFDAEPNYSNPSGISFLGDLSIEGLPLDFLSGVTDHQSDVQKNAMFLSESIPRYQLPISYMTPG